MKKHLKNNIIISNVDDKTEEEKPNIKKCIYNQGLNINIHNSRKCPLLKQKKYFFSD